MGGAGLDRALNDGGGTVRAERRARAGAPGDAAGMKSAPVPKPGQPEQATDAQTQRLAALGFMLASVCHEISNPLAAVHSMLQILQSKRGVSPETLDKGLASIASNIAPVLAITRKLGDSSRAGADAPAPVAIDTAMESA